MDEKTDSRPTNGQGVIPTTLRNFAGVKIYNSIQHFMKITILSYMYPVFR